ncbi:MAG: RNA ligase partner protein [Patescibacteria group bacterium]
MQQSNTYILDTNLFFNMEAGLDMGQKAEDVIRAMTKAIQSRKQEGYLFYMPPRIVEEFFSFFDEVEQTFLQQFIAEISTKSPDYQDMQIGAASFYKLVNDIRMRSYRGMDIGEEEMRKAGQMFMGKEHMDKKGFEMAIGPVIKKFRERYRNATRTGFLDSLADLDILILAKELDGIVVSADEGVMKWARIFGVREIAVPAFGQLLRSSSE